MDLQQDEQINWNLNIVFPLLFCANFTNLQLRKGYDKCHIGAACRQNITPRHNGPWFPLVLPSSKILAFHFLGGKPQAGQ